MMRIPYESKAVQAVTGPALRPGGLELTLRAAERIGLAAGQRVLDVGCGMGATMDHLQRQCGAAVTGIDRSSGLLGKARRKHLRGDLVQADGLALPFRDGSFAALFCECVFSLLGASQPALAQFGRVLQTGGWLVISDLYLIDGAGAPGATGCPAGALPAHTLHRRVKASGFAIALWEDYSHLLKQFAARMVWAGLCPEEMWGPGCRPGANSTFGYGLMLARKEAVRYG